MPLKLKTNHIEPFLRDGALEALVPRLEQAHDTLVSRTGLGHEFLGWLDLPVQIDPDELARVKACAERIRQTSDVLIVIGIGGSYLGARAVIEFLKSSFYNELEKDTPDVYFVGNNISSSYLSQVLSICRGKDVSVNVISKSGTTTEPALAFRVFKKLLEEQYGVEGARERIYATTDRAKGKLKELADAEGYEEFVVPDDIGGRYSVLTPVGLLPIAVAGADVDALLEGAKQAREAFQDCSLQNNCYRYAALRQAMLLQGKSVELFASYEPCFGMMAEWLKQLFGESEGKQHKGLFPASVTFSTDLHSLGQFIQDGSPILFETVIQVERPQQDLFINPDPTDFDSLNYLAGQYMSQVNRKAFEGTLLAHTEGGVPNVVIELPRIDEFETGYLIYFFEKACAISGYMLGVNPFDQPGVESYKKNMFALLGKPGYEDVREQLLQKLGE